MSKEVIINDVRVITNDDGSMTYVPVEHVEVTYKDVEEECKDSGFFSKIWKWFTSGKSHAYVKQRDLADPFDENKKDPFDDGAGSKNAVEVGWKWTF